MRLRAYLFSTLLVLSGCATTQQLTTDAEDIVRIGEMYAGYAEDFPQVRGITAEDLKTAPDDAYVLVDVRTPEEQVVSMIPGAITAEEFDASREDYRDAHIVAYCTIGARSGRFAAELLEDGFAVRNLEGSILSWTHAGGELVGPDGTTKDVHVYGSTWDLAADDYDAVW